MTARNRSGAHLRATDISPSLQNTISRMSDKAWTDDEIASYLRCMTGRTELSVVETSGLLIEIMGEQRYRRNQMELENHRSAFPETDLGWHEWPRDARYYRGARIVEETDMGPRRIG